MKNSKKFINVDYVKLKDKFILCIICLVSICIIAIIINYLMSYEIVNVKTTPIQVIIVNKDYTPANNNSINAYNHGESNVVVFSYNKQKNIIDDKEFFNKVKIGDTATIYSNEFITRKNTVKYTTFTAAPMK